MKVLVCAASKYGATSEIARAVADVLAGRGCEVTVLRPREVGAVEEFDAVVSAIRAQEGDFRNWAQIRAWAAGIADTLLA